MVLTFIFSVGDYVIKINDVSVQDSDISRVKEIEKNHQQEMHLVLRKPKPPNYKLVQLTIPPEAHAVDNVKFSLVASPCSNHDNLFHPYDEIVQVFFVYISYQSLWPQFLTFNV